LVGLRVTTLTKIPATYRYNYIRPKTKRRKEKRKEKKREE
jgi:hypothetical protein